MKTFIDIFDRQFSKIHDSSRELITKVPEDRLFLKPDDNLAPFSFAEYILRSAGKVEQTFGGITTRLWDDPFEWTLPEELSTTAKILEYFDEVEATRLRGFTYLTSDEDLEKELPAPEKLKTIFELLLDTLVDSKSFQNDARRVFELISLS